MLADRPSIPGEPTGTDVPSPASSEPSQRRDLVVVNPGKNARTPKPQSRLTDALFLAHMFATKFKAPQTCEKRRADPAEASARYRKADKKPAARSGRIFSKKI